MAKLKNTKRADGRLQSKIYLGNDKYKYVYAANNKELQAKIDEVKVKLGKGLDIAAERDTFGDWANLWLADKKHNVSENRYEICRYRINNLADLLQMKIDKIRTSDIQAIIYELFEDDYARATLIEIKNTAAQICQLAIDNRIMDYNPAAAVKIPADASKTERRALTDEEQAWIAAPTEHRAQRAAMIMMYAGLRRGELIALTWRDVDLKARTITVNKSVKIIKGQSVLKNTTKTKSGMRMVHIPKLLADYLSTQEHGSSLMVCPDAHGNMMSESAWKRLWESYLAELNFKFGDFKGLLIPDETGNPKQYQKPKSRFAPQKIPMVIPKITAHMLRHTFITMMYMAGVDILTAKEQAGHADIQTTMGIYTHLDEQFKTKQIDKLDDYLSAKTEKSKAI